MPKPRVSYSDELADEICNTISSTTKGIAQLCRENQHWPDRSEIYRWVFKHSHFADQYSRAKARQVEWLVEDMLNIANDTDNDTLTNEKGAKYCNGEWVNRSRLKIDTIKWIACKLAPKIYGDKLLNHNGDNDAISQFKVENESK